MNDPTTQPGQNGDADAANSDGSTATREGPVNAEIGARVLAFLIDAVIGIVLGIVPLIGGLMSAAYLLVRDGLDLEFMDHRSVGKKVMKIRPITPDGTPLDITGSMRRNWMFALWAFSGFLSQVQVLGWFGAGIVGVVGVVVVLIEVYLVFTDPDGRRIGDNMADTRVVESE